MNQETGKFTGRYRKHNPKLADLARQLGVSRQRVWQMFQQSQGLCSLCPDPSVKASNFRLCQRHHENDRNRKRRKAQ